MDKKLWSAVEALESDDSEISRKIKEQISEKVRNYIKSLRIEAHIIDKELQIAKTPENIEIISMDEDSAQDFHKVEIKFK